MDEYLNNDDDWAISIFGTAYETVIFAGAVNKDSPIFGIQLKNPLAVKVVYVPNNAQIEFENILNALVNLVTRDQFLKVRHIHICCSGIIDAATENDWKMAANGILEEFCPNLNIFSDDKLGFISNDVDGALSTGLINSTQKDQNHKLCEGGGITLVSGSGSIVEIKIPLTPNKTLCDKRGGFGSPFTKESGSSYQMGLELFEWLHSNLDALGWDTPKKPDKIINDYLEAVIEHISGVSGVSTPSDFIEQRKRLYHLPFATIDTPLLMRPMIAQLSQLACECICNHDSSPNHNHLVDLKNIKINVADNLLEFYKELMAEHKKAIVNYLQNYNMEKFPVVLEGGSFNCPCFHDLIVTGVEKISANYGIPIELIFPPYHTAFGVFALACEKSGQLFDVTRIKHTDNSATAKSLAFAKRGYCTMAAIQNN